MGKRELMEVTMRLVNQALVAAGERPLDEGDDLEERCEEMARKVEERQEREAIQGEGKVPRETGKSSGRSSGSEVEAQSGSAPGQNEGPCRGDRETFTTLKFKGASMGPDDRELEDMAWRGALMRRGEWYEGKGWSLKEAGEKALEDVNRERLKRGLGVL